MCTDKETNEALVRRVKAGDRDALAALYERNRGLLAILLRRLTASPGSRARMAASGVTFEDLEQESYFAIEQAATLHDPKRGAFTTFLPYAMKSMFFTILGLRTQRQRLDPLPLADSLDRPLSPDEPDGLAFADTVPDSSALQPFAQAEERIFIQQLHSALDECLAAIPPHEASTIRARYYDGRTQGDIAAERGVSVSYVGQMEHNGLRHMRGPGNRHRLEQYREEIISRHAYQGTGFSAWKSGGSAQERIIEDLERWGLLGVYRNWKGGGKDVLPEAQGKEARD